MTQKADRESRKAGAGKRIQGKIHLPANPVFLLEEIQTQDGSYGPEGCGNRIFPEYGTAVYSRLTEAVINNICPAYGWQTTPLL